MRDSRDGLLERPPVITRSTVTAAAAAAPARQWSDQFDPVGVLTLGVVLNQLADKLGNLINDAENAGEVLAASAGAQVASAIEFAKVSYVDALNTTMDKITAMEKQALDDLTTEIGFIEHGVIDEMRHIVERGSMALNVLIGSNHFPQVGWYTPSYVAPASDTLTLEVNGNFFDSARTGFDPVLAVAGHTFPASVKTTFKLSFNVPVSVLKPSASDLTRVDLRLSVPYRKSVVFGVFHEREVATFALSVILLPLQAGTIEFDTDHLETQRFSHPNQSGMFVQESTDDDIPDPIASGRVWIAPASPGWFLNPGEVQFHLAWSEGDWSNFGNRSNATNAAWSIATRHHGVGTSGKVHFYLTWTEYQDRAVHVPAEESAPLEWGSSRSFDVPPGGTWSAKYTDFRGKEFDIASATFENPFVRVVTSGDKVVIVTVP